LTGDGFEADFNSALALGGVIGTTAGNDAVSTGTPVQRQRSEVSNNFDLGIRFRHKRFDTDFTWFVTDINGAIVKQALILPAGSVGKLLGDTSIVSQNSNSAVFVALSTAPVLIRANFSDARLWGLEYTLNARLHRDWTFGGNFTYLREQDKATGGQTSRSISRTSPIKPVDWLGDSKVQDEVLPRATATVSDLTIR
jgi:hemoglobin/transferrin/lactoferrin receptor protein